jgi:hypothetical protein
LQALLALLTVLISHKEFQKSFCKSQFPHKSVKSFVVLVTVKDKLTGLWGSGLLQNDLKETLCGISLCFRGSNFGFRDLRFELRMKG